MKNTLFERLLLAIFTLGLILVSTSFAQNNDKLKKAKRPIPNSYIVVLDDDTDPLSDLLPTDVRKRNIKRVADDLVNRHGGRVDDVYESAIKGFSVKMSADRANSLSRDPRVKYVEEDFEVFAEETQVNAPWGLDRIDQRSGRNTTYEYDTTGLGVHAYVIDSGIRSTHTQFGGRVVFGADYVNAADNGADCDGHGTHVAGIIGGATYGVAKNVTIHNVRVLGCEGTGSGNGLLSAINWVTANHIGPAVANMSIGLDGTSTTLENAIANSIKSGVQYALSAGNENVDACGHSPGGRVPNALTVASTTDADGRSSFSNFGACIDVFAPGSSIRSAWYTSDTITATASGTSMASPFVAGAIARFLQTNPLATPAEIKTALLNSSTPDVVGDAGAGSPNRLLHSNITSNVQPPPDGRTNYALASNGGVAAVSSQHSGSYPAAALNNGDRKGLNWGAGGGWNDNTAGGYPDWAEIAFAGTRTIDQIDVVTVQDAYWSPAEPTAGMTFSQYGVVRFDVQYWTGSTWQTVPGGVVVGNSNVWRRFTFAPVTTQKVRVSVADALAGYTRLVEVEAWGGDSVTPTPTPTPTSTPTPSPAPPPGGRANYALASGGATATASSHHSAGYAPAGAIDGDRRGANWGSGGGWNDATESSHPDWLQVDFGASRTIDELDVFTVQDAYWSPAEPTAGMTFSQYGATAFDVQYWTGSSWQTVPGGQVTGNNNVWRRFTFAPVATTKIRVLVHAALAGYSRIAEVEAWGGGEPAPSPTPTPAPGNRSNVALAANGAASSASSHHSAGYAPAGAIDGDRKGSNWGSGGGWNDADAGAYPDWLQVDFSGTRTIDEVDVFTVQDAYWAPQEPTAGTLFSQYGVTSFDIQYWNGSNWVTVPGGTVTSSNKVWTKVTFPAVQTSKIRVVVNASLGGYSRIVELEAWGT